MGDGLITIYNTKAHVFQINTETKNSWLAKSDSAILVSIVTTTNQASNQRDLKIVATDDSGKVILDSATSPKTVFNKRSQKFAQWNDPNGMIYGLGFNSEVELDEFIETFQQDMSRSQSMFGAQLKHGSTGRLTPETESSPVSQTDWQMRELKYENERLKQALEESSKNAGVWQSELLNLRTNNVKLTQALQESKANVEEWERELSSLRDANKELKLRIMALETARDPEKTGESENELQKYKDYLVEIQSDLRKKEDEIEELQQSMAHLGLKVRTWVNEIL